MSLSIFILCGSLWAADADVEWENDLEFLVRLGRERLDFYADMQRKAMAVRYSSRKDELKLANAVYFFSIRKNSDAEALLSSFAENHPKYARVQYIRGTTYAEQGQFVLACKAFGEYFRKLPTAPEGKRSRKEYVTALQYYNTVLKELGRGDEAAALVDKMPPTEDMGERELTYLKQLSRIEAEEGKLQSGGKVDSAVLLNADNVLRDLFFVRDGISILAGIQSGRIQCIFGNSRLAELRGNNGEIAKIPYFRDAIRIIKQFEDFAQEMENSNSKATSPMPELLYFKAIAIRGLAEVTAAKGDRKLAAKQLSKGALVYFRKIASDYKKSPYVKKLPKQYLLCEDVNARWNLGATLNLPKGGKGALSAQFEPGDILLRDKKDYAGAAKTYREVLDRNGRNPEIIDHAGRYMQCLAMLDRLDDGRAYIEELQRRFPEDSSKQGIGLAALMLGAYADKRMREWPEGKPNPLKNKQMEMYSWGRDRFVELAPGHPQAAAVAYDLAITAYNSAVSALNTAKKAGAGPASSAMSSAHERFRKALPLFQRVATVFPLHDKGHQSLMKLGQIHNILDQRDSAIDCLRRFINADDGTLSRDDLLLSHYLIAELMLRSHRYEDARQAYKTLLEMTAEGKPFAGLKQSALFREIAFATLPDAISRASNLTAGKLALMSERRNRLSNDLYDLDAQIRADEKLLREFPEQEKAVRERTEDCVRVLGAIDLDYRTRAAVQAKAEAAKPNAPKTEQEYFGIFLKGTEDAVRANMATENDAIAARRKALDDGMAALMAEAGRGGAALAALTKSTALLDGAISARGDRIKDIEASFAKIDGDIKSASTEIDAMKAVLETSKDDDELKKTRAALKAQQERLAQLERERPGIVSTAAKQEILACQREIQQKQGMAADNRRQIERLNAEQAIRRQKLQNAQEQVNALEDRVRFMDMVKGAISADEAGRLKQNDAVKAKAAEVSRGVSEASVKELAALAELKGRIAALIGASQEQKKQIQVEIAEIDKGLKPLEDEWKACKKEVVSGYRAYLRGYPAGRYYAVSTTELAAALVDLEDYPEAVQQLGNLVNGKVPECSDAIGNAQCDPQKTASALYNLARAQSRAKRPMEAATTYGRLMLSRNPSVKAAAAKLPLGNLFFIAEQGLADGAPGAALAACEAILSRVKGGNGAEAGGLRAVQVEKCHVMAAQAALKAGNAARVLELAGALLELNPRTAFLYDARFLEAEALVVSGKIDDGIGMLNQMLRRVQDTAVSNRVRCKVSELYLLAGKDGFRERALNGYLAIVDYARESAELDLQWTVSQEAVRNQEWVDAAFLGAAKIYRAAGNAARLNELRVLYRRLFPQGAVISELESNR